jgi:AcrR family transcriptional regulator
MERLLDAAEELISERGASAVTVSEVARRAGSSVGAFYARFPDKDALFSTLHERSCSEALATADLALDPSRWRSLALSAGVSEVVRFTAAMCVQRMQLVMTFIAMAASDRTYSARRAALEAELARRMETLLAARRSEVGHPNLSVAAAMTVRMAFGSLEYGALIHRGLDALHLPGHIATAELTRALVAYLELRPGHVPAAE